MDPHRVSVANPPFFVVGSARSGTTMLRLMLNAHPDVAVPPESRFIVELYPGTEVVQIASVLAKLSSHHLYQAWDLPIEAVRDELETFWGGDETPDRAPYRDVIEAAYRAYARAAGKTRWGDKTPRYVEDIPLISHLFPQARFIHLVRDGRNVALSYADVPFGPKTVARAASLWARRVGGGLQAGRALEPGRYLELRYEDMVEDAKGEAKALCSFLNLEFDPGMLDYTERARGAALQRASRFNPNVRKKPISNVRSWETDMQPRNLEVFEAVAGDVLSELGYPRQYPAPGAWARLAGVLGRAGLPLNRLKSTRARVGSNS